jgi:hypothetical protein
VRKDSFPKPVGAQLARQKEFENGYHYQKPDEDVIVRAFENFPRIDKDRTIKAAKRQKGHCGFFFLLSRRGNENTAALFALDRKSGGLVVIFTLDITFWTLAFKRHITHYSSPAFFCQYRFYYGWIK